MSKPKPADSSVRSNRSTSDTRSAKGNSPAAVEQPLFGWLPSIASVRETVESVVIAFVLAFLFRTFEAEAFVIPTGSMAPTLMGKHKDLYCPKCGHEYQVSASDVSDGSGNSSEIYVWGSTCPMCRYTADIGEKAKDGQRPTFSGDRILVGKFPYQFHDPKRWDVIVFKYPGNSTMNYIKRLVGLPGETVKIDRGDVWIHKPGDPAGHFEIARKPPEKVLATLQLVYDNDLAPTMAKLDWPARWIPSAEKGKSGWKADGAALSVEGGGESWIHYEHLVPTFDAWQAKEAAPGGAAPGEKLARQLISDFTAYNTGQSAVSAANRGWRQPDAVERPDPGMLGAHWVGDLALQAELDVKSADGEVLLELVRGGRRFLCRIDVATGAATLSHDGPGAADFHPQAATAVRGVGRHKVTFSNVDQELRLWVDSRVIAFDAPTTYDARKLQTLIPTPADLEPARIGTRQAALKVEHVKLFRDIYYIAVGLGFQRFNDYLSIDPRLDDPARWPAGAANWEEAYADQNMRTVQFTLTAPSQTQPEKDQFFVLGDNSAQSKDGRLWRRDEYWVDREMLIGKAMFIYWPHSWDEVMHIPFPFFPNFQRMHFIR